MDRRPTGGRRLYGKKLLNARREIVVRTPVRTIPSPGLALVPALVPAPALALAPVLVRSAYRGAISSTFLDFLGRLQPLIAAPENPQIQPYSVKMKLGMASTSSLNENPVGGMRVEFSMGGITNKLHAGE